MRNIFLEKNTSVGNLYETEQLISQSEQQGNRLIQVPTLLIAAILSLRGRAYPKAQLQARRAIILSREWDSLYVSQVEKNNRRCSRLFLKNKANRRKS